MMKNLHEIALILASLVLAWTLLPPLPAAEEKTQTLESASLFVDDAVLRRGMEVPVRGWAAPASKITVAFGGQSQLCGLGLHHGTLQGIAARLGAEARKIK